VVARVVDRRGRVNQHARRRCVLWVALGAVVAAMMVQVGNVQAAA
jgi:hypothetical protein